MRILSDRNKAYSSELVQFFGQHGVAVGVYYRFAAADNLYLFAYFVGVRFEGIIVFGGNGSYDGSLMRVAEDVAEYTSLAGGVDARFGDNVVGAVSGAGHVENRQRQTNAGIPASRTAPYGAVRKECPVKEFFHRCLADAAGYDDASAESAQTFRGHVGEMSGDGRHLFEERLNAVSFGWPVDDKIGHSLVVEGFDIFVSVADTCADGGEDCVSGVENRAAVDNDMFVYETWF